MLDKDTVVGNENVRYVTDIGKKSCTEAFGLKGSCQVGWNNLMRRFMIISVLSCANEYTVLEEQCLLSKLQKLDCNNG